MLAFLLACVPAPEIVGKADSATVGSDCDAPRLSAELTAIPTVIRVAWTTDEPADQVVLYAQGDRAEQVTEVSSGTDHVVLLTGLHALEEVSFQVAPVDGDACGEPATIVAGSLPTGLPTLRVSGDVPDAAEGGFTLVPVIQSGVVWVVGIDAGGSYVWAWPMPGSGDVPVTAFRAALSMDGRAVLVNATASSMDTPGNIYRVALDLSSVETIGVLGGHTDFVERAPREYTTIGWDIRTLDDGRKLLGDTLVEVDDDGQRVVWDAFDWLNVDYAPSYTPGFYLPDPEVEDWSHVNGLDYDADLDAYLVSIGGLHGIARVDRADDAMRWYLSDDEGDFTNAGDRALVESPHSAQAVDGGVLVFNRGEVTAPGACSSADEIALDTEQGVARVVWHYQSEACLLVPFLGQARRLAGGNTEVTFTTSGQIDEVTPDGELAYRLNVPIGAAFGFTDRVTRLGPPSGR